MYRGEGQRSWVSKDSLYILPKEERGIAWQEERRTVVALENQLFQFPSKFKGTLQKHKNNVYEKEKMLQVSI